ncbi:hypothetical protein ACFLZJ_01870 [Nanoarchaeota archaeon]
MTGTVWFLTIRKKKIIFERYKPKKSSILSSKKGAKKVLKKR